MPPSSLMEFLKDSYGIIVIKPYSSHLFKKRSNRHFIGHTQNGIKVFIKLDYTKGQASAREAMILKQLESQNAAFIPSLSSYCAFGPFPFVATRYISGITIERLLHDEKMSDHQKRNLLKQMLRVLSTLQAHRIVHRDVRPANLLFEKSKNYPQGKLYLIDYSFAIKLSPEPLLELPIMNTKRHLLKKMGGSFKPHLYQWDDAYSFQKIALLIDPKCRIKYPDIWRKLNQSIGKLTYRYRLGS